jgi:hypothetical protein
MSVLATGLLLLCTALICMLLNKPITSLAHIVLGAELARRGGYARNPQNGRASSVTIVAWIAAIVGAGLTVAGLLGV